MKNLLSSSLALAVFALAFVVVSLPATWLLMLGFGNIGALYEFWDMLPFGIIISALVVSAGATDDIYILPRPRKNDQK
jgi:hypothetical protein